MDSKELRLQREAEAKKSYERGFQEKCAELGLTADEILEKAAQTVPTNPSEQLSNAYAGAAGIIGDTARGAGKGWLESMKSMGRNAMNLNPVGYAMNRGAEALSGQGPVNWNPLANIAEDNPWTQFYRGASGDIDASAGQQQQSPQGRAVSTQAWQGWNPAQQQRAMEAGRMPNWDDVQKEQAKAYSATPAQNASGGGNYTTGMTPSQMMI